MSFFTRIMSIILALVMCTSLIPVSVVADVDEDVSAIIPAKEETVEEPEVSDLEPVFEEIPVEPDSLPLIEEPVFEDAEEILDIPGIDSEKTEEIEKAEDEPEIVPEINDAFEDETEVELSEDDTVIPQEIPEDNSPISEENIEIETEELTSSEVSELEAYYYGTYGRGIIDHYDEETCTLTFTGDENGGVEWKAGHILSDIIPEDVKKIIFGERINIIGSSAFQSCGAEEIVIGNDVTDISSYAFNNCVNLKSISIGSGLKNISTDAFSECRAIESIVIPGNVETIGTFAFWACNSLKNVELQSGVRTISEGAFSGCSNLSSITFPGTLETVGGFAGLEKLTEVILPAGIKVIATAAFSGCTSLSSITIPGTVESIEDEAFSETSIRSLVIPDSVKKIGSGIVSECALLSEITFGSGITDIGDEAFAGASMISSISLPSIQKIGERAFSGCSNLSAATFGNSLISVGDGAFEDCVSLKSVTFPDSVEYVGSRILEGCTGLEELSIGTGLVTIADEAFTGITVLQRVICSSKLSTVGARAFYGCSGLSELELGNSVSVIGDEAFAECTSLNSVILPDCLTAFGNGAFSACSSLSSLKLGVGLTDISVNSFRSCASLKNIALPVNIKHISSGAFEACSLETALFMHESGSSLIIEKGAFSQDNSEISISVPNAGSINKAISGYPWKEFGIDPKFEGREGSELSLSAQYMLLENGEEFRITSDSSIENYDNYLTWSVMDENGETLVGVLSVITDGEYSVKSPLIRATGVGVAFIKGEVDYLGKKYTALCRVDVVPADVPSYVRSAKILTSAATVELYKTDYTEIEIQLELDQSVLQSEVSSSLNASAAVIPIDSIPSAEKSGSAVKKAEFTDTAVSGLFRLDVVDDSHLKIVPELSTISSMKSGGKFSSSIDIFLSDSDAPMTTDNVVSFTVKLSKPSVKCTKITLNSFYPDGKQKIVFSSGEVLSLERDSSKPSAYTEYYSESSGFAVGLSESGKTIRKNVTENVAFMATVRGWAIKQAITVPATVQYAEPKIKLSSASVSFPLNTDSACASVRLLSSDKKTSLEMMHIADVRVVSDGYSGDYNKENFCLEISPDRAPMNGEKVRVEVLFEGSPVKKQFDIKVVAQNPAFKLKTSSVKLNPVFSETVSASFFAPAGSGFCPTDETEPPTFSVFNSAKNPVSDELKITGFHWKTEPSGSPVGSFDISSDNAKYGETYTVVISHPSFRQDLKLTVKTAKAGSGDPQISISKKGNIDVSDVSSYASLAVSAKNFDISAFGDGLGEDDRMELSVIKVEHQKWDNTDVEICVASSVYEYDDAYFEISGDPVNGFTIRPSKENLNDIHPVTSLTHYIVELRGWVRNADGAFTEKTARTNLGAKSTIVKFKFDKTSVMLNRSLKDAVIIKGTLNLKGYEVDQDKLYIEPQYADGTALFSDAVQVEAVPEGFNSKGFFECSFIISGHPYYGETYGIRILPSLYRGDTSTGKPQITVKVIPESANISAQGKITGSIDYSHPDTFALFVTSYKNAGEASEKEIICEINGNDGNDYTDDFRITDAGNGRFTIAAKRNTDKSRSYAVRTRTLFRDAYNDEEYYEVSTSWMPLPVKIGKVSLKPDKGTVSLYSSDRFSYDLVTIKSTDTSVGEVTGVSCSDNRFSVTPLGGDKYMIAFKNNDPSSFSGNRKAVKASLTIGLCYEGCSAPAGTVKLSVNVQP